MKVPNVVTQSVSGKMVNVSPDIAQYWLETASEGNRPVSRTIVSDYVSEMCAGNWKIGEPIKFNKAGKLVDGQHRLNAVLVSGLTVPMYVMTGLDLETSLVLDTGKTRNPADAMVISGLSAIPNKFAVSACARLAILWDENGLTKIHSHGGRKIHNHEIVDWVKNNYDIATKGATSGRLTAESMKPLGATRTPIRPAIFAFGDILFSRVDIDAAKSFYDNIHNGSRQRQGDPITTLARMAMNQSLRLSQQLALLIHTWNDVRAGEAHSYFRSASYAIGADMPIPK